MATTAEFVATHFGVTMQQAHDFVLDHLNDLSTLYSLALNNGVTTAMLGEIAGGYTGSDVLSYFSAHGIDASMLDPEPITYYTVGLTGVPGDMG